MVNERKHGSNNYGRFDCITNPRWIENRIPRAKSYRGLPFCNTKHHSMLWSSAMVTHDLFSVLRHKLSPSLAHSPRYFELFKILRAITR